MALRKVLAMAGAIASLTLAVASPAMAAPDRAAMPGTTVAAANTVTPAVGGCTPRTSTTVNCHVWKTTTTYGLTTLSRPEGMLFAGTNYFYCQDTGQEISAEGFHNDWWALTDDDSGNTHVWISVIYISGGVNDASIPGLRHC